MARSSFKGPDTPTDALRCFPRELQKLNTKLGPSGPLDFCSRNLHWPFLIRQVEVQL